MLKENALLCLGSFRGGAIPKNSAVKQLAETTVAEPLIPWLEASGWEVFQEVKTRDNGPRYDIVAKKKKLLWIIEVKTRFSADVVSQAWHATRAHIADLHSVAVPQLANYRSHVGPLLNHVCRTEGIGVIEIFCPDWSSESECKVKERLQARQSNGRGRELFDSLNDSQKAFAAAGNSTGKHWSPFQQTCLNLAVLVRYFPGYRINDAVRFMRHHYPTDMSAAQSLRKWVSINRVRGVTGRWKDWGKRGKTKTFRIYPADVEGSERL